MSRPDRPIFEHFPGLSATVPWISLGDFPTPLQSADDCVSSTRNLLVKRDDLSSRHYGGNKVRTLEVLFADALKRGSSRIVATGAYGSNHATATALHAPRCGLTPSATLFPQPRSACARENLETMLGLGMRIDAIPHWSALPYGMWKAGRGAGTTVMEPGGATPLGALGYVSAALELAGQIEARGDECPAAIVVGVGSTCTSAGLLIGTQLAADLGVGFRRPDGTPCPPTIVSVRVTPWPVTSPVRIVRLALGVKALLSSLSNRADQSLSHVGYRDLNRRLRVDGSQLGRRLWRADERRPSDDRADARA